MGFRNHWWLVSLIVLSWPSTSSAQEQGGWDATFAPAAASSYLPGGEVGIIVVAAGAVSPERDAAAAALEAALRASGRASLVLDDSSLGELGEIDDAAVLSRSAKLPITHVAVLRLVEGDPPKALVTLYPKAGGDMLAAFVAKKGFCWQPARPGRQRKPLRMTAAAAARRARACRRRHWKRLATFARRPS